MTIGNYIRHADRLGRRTADLIDCGGVFYCGTSSGAGNSYELKPYPRNPNTILLDAYSTGIRYYFKADKTNTGPATAAVYTNPNSPTLLASKNIVKGPAAAALAAGDIQINDYVTLSDDGTNFVLIALGKTITASGGSSVTTTETEVDFGSTPQVSKTFNIVDAAVSAPSKILVWPSGNVATGRVGNDLEWDGIVYAGLAAAGSFTLTALCTTGSVVGKRKIFYQVA